MNNDYNILALDPATKMGWAHSNGPSGTWDLSVRRDESGGMRLIRLVGKLDEVLRLAGINIVAYEAARHAAPKMQGALVVQTELQGVIKIWCHNNKIEYRGFSPSEIKKFATGKGNAGKAMMIAAAVEKCPDRFNLQSDDNEVDAWFILELMKSAISPATQEATR